MVKGFEGGVWSVGWVDMGKGLGLGPPCLILADYILIFIIDVLDKIFIHGRVEPAFAKGELLNFVLDEEILQFEFVTMIG